ncbi:MAG: SPFH domain-containing protein [Scandinavium sp.]|uniref:protease modulator HflK n=1 Tax=Scandinavium sp. TaxID=2830653 RepID=UPI003F348E6A
MLPNLTGEHGAQERRLRVRLLWCRAFACLLLILSAVLYWMPLSVEQTSWLAFARPLISGALLGLAVIENALCQLPSLRKSRVMATEADGEKKKIWQRPVPPGITLWFRHLWQHGLTLAAAVLAITIISANFSAQHVLAPLTRGQIPVASLLLTACFVLLVCERMLSFRPLRHWPQQKVCVGLLRALLSVFLITTLALALVNAFSILAYWTLYLASLLVIVVAAEFLIRAVATIWIAPSPARKTPFLTQSLLAEQYRWPLHPLLSIRKKIVQHFGVDIGQIQAFRLIGKIFVPVACVIALTGWLMSGISEVSVSQRGVYERFGKPTEVLLPGVHVGLPWPFGRVLPVDFGAVHELALSEAQPEVQPSSATVTDLIEGPAPQESWRLWDSSHSTDQAQVIASAVGDKQSFQIVNMDIRLIWRVGLHDNDALNSLYQTDDLPTTIQRVARQVMTQYFSHQQLDALLNEQRATMATKLNREIQQRLNALNTGVELLYTRIESIHPPAGAANAYHGVQAAQIAANASIAREKGYAASTANDAQRKATTAIDGAQASANEMQAQATASLTRYSADYESWKINPEAYLNERRYQAYSKALAKTPLLILDSQLSTNNESVLDTRQFAPSSRQN